MAEESKWRGLLARLVASAGTDLYPLNVFEVPPPSGLTWPRKLASGPALRDFYALCDGGDLSLQYKFLPLAELADETRRWADELPDLSSDDLPYRLTAKMVVLGENCDGSILVWDGKADRVSTLDWRGGDWEPLDLSFDEFMEALFTDPTRVNADDLWEEALRQLRAK